VSTRLASSPALSSSWINLDNLIKESKAKELERQLLEERLRTEEGLKRQQSILEHEEDINELMDFMHKAGPPLTLSLSHSLTHSLSLSPPLSHLSLSHLCFV
jgi:hypothetical protein